MERDAMKFRARILATLAVPLTLVVALGGAAALGVAWLDRGIAGYIAHEDALARAAAEMYAQGLQTGQAIRNIILEPANPKAYENRKAAVADYDKAREAAEAAAQTPEQKSLMARIGELRAAHAKVQDEVEALVKADPKDVAPAVAKLRAAETPAWRKLKDELLALKAKAAADMTAERDGAMAGMRRARNFVLALTVACFVACAFFARGLLKYVDREIGGEPSEAREALKRIEAGDLASPVQVRPGDAHSVMSAVAHMRERLLGLVTQVSGTAHFVAGASDRIAEGNADLSARTEAQASALEQTSATMEQLTATVKENAAHAQDADRIAKEAAAVAHEGGEVVAKVADSMKGMTDNSNRIREHHRRDRRHRVPDQHPRAERRRWRRRGPGSRASGFAVVASEVRDLASAARPSRARRSRA
jgi:methyl-accepting chemotaxis protein